MCGIFGAYDWMGASISNGPAMADALKHRGPNAEGIFQDAGIMLGNRRLSIIDLSEASNQPIISDDGDIVVVQNGEIYNYIELRDTLCCAGHVFKTDGDTEVLLRAFLVELVDFYTVRDIIALKLVLQIEFWQLVQCRQALDKMKGPALFVSVLLKAFLDKAILIFAALSLLPPHDTQEFDCDML